MSICEYLQSIIIADCGKFDRNNTQTKKESNNNYLVLKRTIFDKREIEKKHNTHSIAPAIITFASETLQKNNADMNIGEIVGKTKFDR